MHFFSEFYIKNSKKFWLAWNKALNELPEAVHFIQSFSSKDGKLCIAVWQSESEALLNQYVEEHFSGISENKIYEIDDYHLEGQPLNWIA